MKRILFIMTTLGGGGAEKVLVDILRHFDYTKYHVDLLLTTGDGIYTSSVDKHVTQYVLYNTCFAKYLRRILLFCYRKLNWQWLLRVYVRKNISNQYDAIISFMEGEPLLLHSYLFDKGRKNISWVHSDFLHHNWSKWLFQNGDEYKLYQQLDSIVFVSNDSKQQFNKVFKLESKPLQCVIYNLIDTDYIKRNIEIATIEKRKFTICTVGRLSPPKRYDRLVDVAVLLKQNNYDVDIWLIGEGRLFEELKFQAEKSGVTDMIHFLGFHNPPYAYLRQADIFISTSEVEGMPLVICEALTIGLPIVATKTTGSIELLDNNTYGVLTDHDVDSIYNSIVSLIDNIDSRTHYAKQAITRSHMFDTKATMHQIYAIL